MSDKELTQAQKFESYTRQNFQFMMKEITEIREVLGKIANQFDKEIADLKGKKVTKVNAKAIEQLKGFK